MKRMKKRLNCWEFMKCGREPGGANEGGLGACAAATAVKMDGVHGGRKGGRACWVVAGTFCCGKTQGMYVHKHIHCVDCEFFKLVKAEEKEKYVEPRELLRQMQKKNESEV